MSRIALLHPQCSTKGGAIQMALQTAQALQSQGHTVTLYTFDHSPDCFPDLQKGISIKIWGKKKGTKLINIITLAYHLRHFDMIIANNPPMQIVAALVKVFFGKKVQTIWWHHHVPWYLSPKNKIKSFLERHLIIPYIDEIIATSHFVADKVRKYCGRDSVVIHPVIQVTSLHSAREYPRSSTTSLKGVLGIPPVYDHTLERGTGSLDSDRVTLFTHGRLEAGKGLDMLTRVFDEIKREKRKEKKDGIVSVSPLQISPVRRGGGEGAGGVELIIFGTGSLESKLCEEGRDVRPFRGEETFSELSTGKYGHVIGVYCSSIDAFGMASLESQMAGFETIVMDRGGASEAILSNVSGEPVGHLVDSEEELIATISYFTEHKMFPEQMSNVNFSHKRDYFFTPRLASDLLLFISKINS